MRPTLKQLRYLVAIAETGKFGAAAKASNVSQPSLSAQLADMELELGVTLVERGRHGAVMTPAGAETVRKARLILAAVEELKSAVHKGSGTLAGRLRLGVIPSIGPYLLPSAAKRLHELFPEFRINVYEERTVGLEAQLRDGQLDTIISTAEDHVNVRTFPLVTEELWVCIAPDHQLAKENGPIGLEELSGVLLLSLGHGHNLNHSIRELARQSGAVVSHEYEGTSLDAIRQMAAMGAGAAVLPSLYALVEAKRDDALVVRKINHANAKREISLIWRDTSPMQDQMLQLGEILKSVAEDLVSGKAK